MCLVATTSIAVAATEDIVTKLKSFDQRHKKEIRIGIEIELDAKEFQNISEYFIQESTNNPLKNFNYDTLNMLLNRQSDFILVDKVPSYLRKFEYHYDDGIEFVTKPRYKGINSLLRLRNSVRDFMFDTYGDTRLDNRRIHLHITSPGIKHNILEYKVNAAHLSSYKC